MASQVRLMTSKGISIGIGMVTIPGGSIVDQVEEGRKEAIVPFFDRYLGKKIQSLRIVGHSLPSSSPCMLGEIRMSKSCYNNSIFLVRQALPCLDVYRRTWGMMEWLKDFGEPEEGILN